MKEKLPGIQLFCCPPIELSGVIDWEDSSITVVLKTTTLNRYILYEGDLSLSLKR